MTSSPAHAPGVHRSRHTGSVQRRKDPTASECPGPSAPPCRAQAFSAGVASACPPRRATPRSHAPAARAPGERCVLLETGMRNVPHSGLQRAARSAGPGSRRRRNAERVAVSPPDATIGLPATGTGTTPGRDRPTVSGPAHTGRARRRDAGRRGRAGGLDAGSRRGLLRALERWLALGGADPDEPAARSRRSWRAVSGTSQPARSPGTQLRAGYPGHRGLPSRRHGAAGNPKSYQCPLSVVSHMPPVAAIPGQFLAGLRGKHPAPPHCLTAGWLFRWRVPASFYVCGAECLQPVGQFIAGKGFGCRCPDVWAQSADLAHGYQRVQSWP